MKQAEINDKMSEGYVHARSILEMVGRPKEHIESTLNSYVEKIKNEEAFEVIKSDFEESKEVENEMFSTFVELEILAKSAEDLVWFCFDYMPSSIEIIEPEEIKYKTHEFTNFLNDLQTRLHNTDMVAKKLNATNMKLNANIAAMLNNSISMCIKNGQQTLEEISKGVGIRSEELSKILGSLVEAKKLKKEGEKYSL